MKTVNYLLALLIILTNFKISKAQTDDDIAKATEFSIPSSGSFNLLGVNPTNVSRPGFTKDFSIGNFVKDGKILDDIAIDAQPFWILLFKNKSLTDYKKDSQSFARILSKINISAGTSKQNDARKFAYSGKYTIQKDPMMDTAYISSIENMTAELGFNDLKIAMAVEIDRLEDAMNAETDAAKKDSLKSLWKAKMVAFDEFGKKIEESVIEAKKELAEKYIEDHWNNFVMDIGVGQVYTYSSDDYDSVKFSTNGFGVWLNPAFGLCKNSKNKIQIAGLFKWIQVDKKDDMYAGINCRYGTSKINAFVEYVYEDNNNTVSQTFAYGATYKIDNKKVITLGLKRNLDKDLNLKRFYPEVSINWALAKDILK